MALPKKYDKPFETKPNTGVLFASKSKTSEKQPDYNGNLLIDLSEFEVVDNQVNVSLGGWKNTMGNGATYLRISASKPWVKEESGSAFKRTSETDDVPF